jgi:F-type H+-transporting ATPase subunit a
MVPYSFTPTSHLILTFSFSFLTFITGTLVGLYRNGLHFFSLFLPAGAPVAIAPFIIVIEIISYLARLFSLAIRLFANIMAGHTLLKILTSFCWIMLNTGVFLFIVQWFPLVIVFAITGLEIIIGMLQAYVFTMLSIIYFNDAFNLH